ncbi:MAG: protein ybaB [Schlesneria sp.]|nr:protein ybaB [Schlesneria sp.]
MLKEFAAVASMLKQAQGMSGKLQEVKDRIASLKSEGQAGAGMVTVEVSGSMKVLSCRIDPTLFQSGDREMVEELVCSATNQAFDKIREAQMKEMQAVTGGIDIPGLSSAMSGLGL